MYIRWPYIYMEYTWHIPTIYLIGVPDVERVQVASAAAFFKLQLENDAAVAGSAALMIPAAGLLWHGVRCTVTAHWPRCSDGPLMVKV